MNISNPNSLGLILGYSRLIGSKYVFSQGSKESLVYIDMYALLAIYTLFHLIVAPQDSKLLMGILLLFTFRYIFPDCTEK